MSSREQDSSDFDLETFVDLFDTALASDNPAVKKALRNLMMISTLVNSNQENKSQGPLRRLVDDVKNLNRRLSQLEAEQKASQSHYTDVYKKQWITSTPHTLPSTGIPPYWPPGTIIGTSGLTGGTYTTSTASSDHYSIDKDEILNAMMDAKYEALLQRFEEK